MSFFVIRFNSLIFILLPPLLLHIFQKVRGGYPSTNNMLSIYHPSLFFLLTFVAFANSRPFSCNTQFHSEASSDGQSAVQ